MFKAYLALGDSMSIDSYPAMETESLGLKCRRDIGAAALLHKNESVIFPEFNGSDLVTRYPGISFRNLAKDGATTHDMLSDYQVRELRLAASEKALVTLTIGGNDLLVALGKGPDALGREVIALQERYESVVRMIRAAMPDCVLFPTTVYDPTDGTGIVPARNVQYGSNLPIEYLDQFNDFLRNYAETKKFILADVHRHFLGHGAQCDSVSQFWYWKPSPIEPGYRGASEIRRIWLMKLNQVIH
ncbi:MAG: SGNH/GDSL hydrolase family protein [Cyanobacteria bacterium SZAS LIN-3]|nr:SGNH/GDSL hydrolase family protein [Cyanobacteria bacterium SZAS LIN-3]